MERNAKITLKTDRLSMSENDFESAVDMLERIFSQSEGGDIGSYGDFSALMSKIQAENEISELITEGKVICGDGGSVILQYNESELTGMEGCVTKIMFGKNRPSFIVMMRDGEVSTSLSFEEGKRHMSRYNTPYSTFNVSIDTVRVDNTFEENGKIVIEYLIEVLGLSTDRCILYISADFVD